MDEKKIEELAIAMAESRGVTPEEAAYAISNVILAFGKVEEAFVEVARVLTDAISQLWGEVKECVEQLEEGRHNHDKKAWPPVLDMRKQSQVISNKPRFIVRKIIH